MRVAIAEDSGVIRQGLVAVLTTAGMEVVAEAETGEALLELLDAAVPDVVLLDLRMPPTFTNEGVVTAKKIKLRFPNMGVLVLSVYNDTPQALQLFEEDPRGIGYLLKDHVSDVGALNDYLQRISRGDIVIDPDVVRRLVDARRRNEELAVLSPRERDVLGLMAEGHTNRGIGARLYLGTRTVDDHVQEIFRKLRIGTADTDINKRVRAVLAWLRATGGQGTAD